MEFQQEKERIFALDASGKLIAEVTFPILEGVADINHTFVDESLRGQGVAAMLLEAVASRLRAENQTVRPTCSYAVKWFAQHPEYQDLLDPAALL